MCGIVSYIGNKPAKDVLIQGLKSLEYRGYDSAGLGILDAKNNIQITKSLGKIVALEKLLQEDAHSEFQTSTCGIGHTRWATHGEPSVTNAHPHVDHFERVALVHNGIINNYLQLKEDLIQEGYLFRTETDTEVVSNLFAFNRKNTDDNLVALRKTIAALQGNYALAVISPDQNGEKKIYVAKNGSPLVIGVGEGEKFIASDSSTVLQFTDKVLRLKDQQMAEITADAVQVYDIEGNKVQVKIQQLIQTASILEKGPYKHFLLKEINEQPGVVSKMLEAAFNTQEGAFSQLDFDQTKIKRVLFLACGSAYHAALVGKFLLEHWAGIPVEVAIGSEYIDTPALLSETDLVIGISQSGETADTLGAIKNAKAIGAKVMAITNKGDSAIADLCEPNVYVTPAGVEVSVASTKAFTSQVLSLYLLALNFAEAKQSLDPQKISSIKSELRTLPLLLDQVIERAEDHYEIFHKYINYRDFLFLSRGVNYPIALEGALKLKELSYIHATGYPSGEMKHGPIAILDQTVPVLSIAISGTTDYEQRIYSKALHNAEEARARKSPSLVIACDSNTEVNSIFDDVIRIPEVSQLFSPIIATVPLQFLAYYVANELGKDVDQPRNLAKSVTVE